MARPDLAWHVSPQHPFDRRIVFRRLRHLLSWLERRQQPAGGLPAGIVAAADISPPMLVSDAFTPTHPRTGRAGLIGRERDIDMIIQRLMEDKAHIVLYSERGMGKTSLANSVIDLLRRRGVFVIRYQCEASSTFDSLMRGLARSVPGTLLAGPVRPDLLEGCEAALPAAPIRPEHVVALLPRLRLTSLVCVIDEVDRIGDAETRTLLADTMKQLSDRGIPLLFMLIGVSDSLEQLLGEHPSIQRALTGVPLRLLSDEEIATIVDQGAREAGLTFPRELVASIARAARGLPYLAHLLGLRTAQSAARRSTRHVAHEDLAAAVEQLVMETPLRVVQRYDELPEGGADVPMRQTLEALARCEQDKLGRLRVGQKSSDRVFVGGRAVDLASWQALRKAGIVRPCKRSGGYVTFAHRGLHQFLTLRLAAEECRLTGDSDAGERPAQLTVVLADPGATPFLPRQSSRG